MNGLEILGVVFLVVVVMIAALWSSGQLKINFERIKDE